MFGQESTRFLLVPGSITRGSGWTAIDQTILKRLVLDETQNEGAHSNIGSVFDENQYFQPRFNFSPRSRMHICMLLI